MLYAPLADQGSTISLFRPDICRSLQFRLNGHVESYGKLQGYRYSLPPELLFDSRDHFKNNCFCPSASNTRLHKSCRRNGALSNCSDGELILYHLIDSCFLWLRDNELFLRRVELYHFLFLISSRFPFITSLPHFLNDQKEYLTQTVGLSPNEAQHESFVDVEPVRFYFCLDKTFTI